MPDIFDRLAEKFTFESGRRGGKRHGHGRGTGRGDLYDADYGFVDPATGVPLEPKYTGNPFDPFPAGQDPRPSSGFDVQPSRERDNATAYLTEILDVLYRRSRPLSEEEKRGMGGLFNEQMLESLKVYPSKVNDALAYAYALRPWSIHVQEGIPHPAPSTLAHETAHLEQFRHPSLSSGTRLNPATLKRERAGPRLNPDNYDYGGVEGLTRAQKAGRRFADFGIEQQATIVEDFLDEVDRNRDLRNRILRGEKASIGDYKHALDASSQNIRVYAPFIHEFQQATGMLGGQPESGVADYVRSLAKQASVASTEKPLPPKSKGHDIFDRLAAKLKSTNGKPAGDSGDIFDALANRISPSNTDLYNRPHVKVDNKTATVRSIGIGTDRGYVVIPTVAEDGSRILSNDEAIEQWKHTGKHLGIFKNQTAGDAYARQLHWDYEAGKYDKRPATPAPDIFDRLTRQRQQ